MSELADQTERRLAYIQKLARGILGEGVLVKRDLLRETGDERGLFAVQCHGRTLTFSGNQWETQQGHLIRCMYELAARVTAKP